MLRYKRTDIYRSNSKKDTLLATLAAILLSNNNGSLYDFTQFTILMGKKGYSNGT